MTTWLRAHQTANLAAAQAHADLGVDPSQFPVDVYAAIHAANVKLLWRPLPRAFGWYLNDPAARPGILVNNQLTATVQRHTAGHELGHHFFGHGSRVDLDLDPFAIAQQRWTAPEKAAEAFAVWFLMPRRAVTAAMAALRLDRLRTPAEVYQLSLLLGTSYQFTARHLVNLRMATAGQTRAWMAVPPNRLKQVLDPGVAPLSRAHDVWRINRSIAGATLTASPGDRLVIDPDGAAEQLTVTTWRDEPAPINRVPDRPTARRRTPDQQRPTTSRSLTVEILPCPRPGPGRRAPRRLDVRVGLPDDDRGWDFIITVEQVRHGPLDTPETQTDGTPRTTTISAATTGDSDVGSDVQAELTTSETLW